MARDSATPDSNLPPLVNRRAEQTALARLLSQGDTPVYLYGPKGAGKTHLVRHALKRRSSDTPVCVLSCLEYDSQYKVLAALCNAVAAGQYTTGYHAAQLYRVLTEALADQELLLVLDDSDFLLHNDGNDLLYALSRLEGCPPHLVIVSATHPELTPRLDARTYSSLQPSTVTCDPYSKAQTRRILDQRSPAWIDQPVPESARDWIAAKTANIRFAVHWLTLAAEVTDSRISTEVLHLVHEDAIRRYRTSQLAPFTVHHRLLLGAIDVLTSDTEPVRSGPVYDSYRQLCSRSGRTPLSTRRISDFLKHLELLDLIRVEYHYGGDEGKTRHIWAQREF